MTGDSVLDAPALKQADVGIALEAVGNNLKKNDPASRIWALRKNFLGSAFAKEAADIVLVRNDLIHIAKGISQARLLFDNLKKTITYTLSHLLPELAPILLTLILGFPLGMTSLQVF